MAPGGIRTIFCTNRSCDERVKVLLLSSARDLVEKETVGNGLKHLTLYNASSMILYKVSYVCTVPRSTDGIFQLVIMEVV